MVQKKCSFYDEKQFALIEILYGSMNHLQTKGNEVPAHEQ